MPWSQRTERLPQSRKLELNGYLTKPTTRLGRYNLLLREILKHTPPDHPDQTLIPKAMNVIAEFLGDVNHETGKTESQFSLQLLAEKLSYKPPTDEAIMLLDLENPQRKLIMKGSLKKKGSSSSESADLQVFVLDHCLLIVKSKFVQGEERYKIYKKVHEGYTSTQHSHSQLRSQFRWRFSRPYCLIISKRLAKLALSCLTGVPALPARSHRSIALTPSQPPPRQRLLAKVIL